MSKRSAGTDNSWSVSGLQSACSLTVSAKDSTGLGMVTGAAPLDIPRLVDRVSSLPVCGHGLGRRGHERGSHCIAGTGDRALRLVRTPCSTGVLHRLPLVQHRASPWRDRDAHPGRRPSSSNPERAGPARAHPSSRLDPSSRTLRSRHPETRPPSRSGLDQSTRDIHNRRNCSVNRDRQCLKVVDRFRSGTAP